jgi:hypothetical protein
MKILQNEMSGTRTGLFRNFDSKFPFSLSASSPATYIFTAPTCKTTRMTLEPCALNAEFQHFILRFNKIPNFANTTKRGDRGAKAGPKTRQRQDDFTDNPIVHTILNIFKILTSYVCDPTAFFS